MRHRGRESESLSCLLRTPRRAKSKECPSDMYCSPFLDRACPEPAEEKGAKGMVVPTGWKSRLTGSGFSTLLVGWA